MGYFVVPSDRLPICMVGLVAVLALVGFGFGCAGWMELVNYCLELV